MFTIFRLFSSKAMRAGAIGSSCGASLARMVALALCAASGWLAPAIAEPVRDVLERPALKIRHPARVALVDVVAAGPRIVAVGERGFIGLSDDAGQTWRQAASPVSVTLTAVHFPTPNLGWAVGHGGVVLHSRDGGETWKLQLDGTKMAELELKAAKTAGAAGGPASRLQTAQRLAAEGTDKVLLGVHFVDAHKGIAVGAYGLIFATQDGGQSWQPWSERIDNPKGLHLYAVDAAGQQLCIAGEQGLVLRSGDGGRTFARRATPYRGSYFAVSCAAAGEVLAAGLNGNAFWSGDGGANWSRVDTAGAGTIVAARAAGERRIWMAGQAGTLLSSDDGGRSFRAAEAARAPISSFVLLPDATIVAVGIRGAARLAAAAVTPGASK